MVVTDNNPLSHLQTAKLGAIGQRWAAELALFNLTIKFRPRKQNASAYVLSRHPVQEPDGPGESETRHHAGPPLRRSIVKPYDQAWLDDRSPLCGAKSYSDSSEYDGQI
ncbi:Pol polyprotein [Elysia marginata]|uniref:Pol polyprotein n=1 Tax=Elysia marginata TaxID=1093978 RepID=A0AAV4I9K3_9GAST|nr:Pol polyprotein [Elysia marginata]